MSTVTSPGATYLFCMANPLCRCDNNVGTIAIVASREGEGWDKLTGGPALHVVVDAPEAHTTNYTWYGQIMCTFEGISYVRWNMASVAGCTLGPMRTVAAMRNDPWRLPITNVPVTPGQQDPCRHATCFA
jgi:hypothetical protein